MNLKDLPIGEKAPEEVNVVIEIPQGSSIKYEVDEETGAVTVDRFLHTAMYYPFNYGFVPGTHASDGDPLDILVISQLPASPGTVMKVKPIGMLDMEDESGQDEKIVAVPREKVDPEYGKINDMQELPQSFQDKIAHFFEHYKDLEKGKWVKVRDWHSKEKAFEAILSSKVKD